MIVGDKTVGKRCILMKYTEDEIPRGNVPSVFGYDYTRIVVNKKHIDLLLTNTAGIEEYGGLRLPTYF